MPYANIDVRPLSPVIGAEIHGVDLASGLDDATFRDVHQALLDHLVIFLPDQRVGPIEQLAFARRFGEVEPPHPVHPRHPQHPEVTVIEQDDSRPSIYNDSWHTDTTFRVEPAMATLLHAQVLPASGGDTLWSSLYAAYEALSPSVRDMIEDLIAVHDYYSVFAPSVLDGRGGMDKLLADIRQYPPIEHPVVRTHPETGRKALFVNRTFTQRLKGLTPVEGDYILRMLCEIAENPNFQLRRTWKPFDLAMWDNRCTMHFATSNFSGRRSMNRITVLGDRPYH